MRTQLLFWLQIHRVSQLWAREKKKSEKFSIFLFVSSFNDDLRQWGRVQIEYIYLAAASAIESPSVNKINTAETAHHISFNGVLLIYALAVKHYL